MPNITNGLKDLVNVFHVLLLLLLFPSLVFRRSHSGSTSPGDGDDGGHEVAPLCSGDDGHLVEPLDRFMAH